MLPYQNSDHLTGGRRMGGDRRNFSYACCVPERRSNMERRSVDDRRQQSRINAIMVADENSAAVPNRSSNVKD